MSVSIRSDRTARRCASSAKSIYHWIRTALRGRGIALLRRPQGAKVPLLAVATALLLLLVAPASQAAVTSCALEGVYISSAAVDAPTSDFLGKFVFTPPVPCEAS